MIRSRTSPLAALLVMLFVSATVRTSAPQDARDVARAAFPSVVMLRMFDDKLRDLSLASAFFVGESLIVTNYHSIKGASYADARLVGQKGTFRVSGLVASDTTNDLALLEVSGLKGVPLSLYGGTVEPGEEVFALGNPRGLEGTISAGIVSGIEIRHLAGASLIQITAPISPGSSGGPVVNRKNQVVGVAVASLEDGQSLNFAVPAVYVKRLLAFRGAATPLLEVATRTERSAPPVSAPPDPECTPSIRGITGEVPTTAYSYVGTEALRAGDYQRGRDAFAYVVRRDPNDHVAHSKLGLAYYHLGCLAQAIAAFQRSIRLKPKEQPPYLFLARAYEDSGRPKDAIEAYKEAIRLKPKAGETYFHVAFAYDAVGRDADAIAAMKTAIAAGFEKHRCNFFLALSYWKLGRMKEAEDSLRESLRLDPQYAPAHLELGRLCVYSDRPEEAHSHHRALVLLDAEKAERLRKLIDSIK